VPAERIICLSTTHLGFLNRLGEQNRVIGAGGTDYLFNPALRKAAQNGEITDIGYEGNLNKEKIIELQPDLLTLYKIEGENHSSVEMAQRYGLPNILIYEYAEPSILGQAEWIKVFGLLTGTEKKADSIFHVIKTNYRQLKALVEDVDKKPSVLLNMPWKGTWYVPSGQSNIAELVSDAGGNYLWKKLEGKHNQPMNIESVYEKAENAELWLNPGQAKSKEDILTVDSRLKNFKTLKSGKIYNRIARISPSGGNDYMESGVVNPDKILSDLISILHPDIFSDSLYYYKKLD
jgi:iron complex transport system substrate-binding protein